MTACVKCGHDPDAEVLIFWSFTVDREPPSLNDHLVNLPGFRGRAYRRIRDEWCWEFRAARLLNKITQAQLRRRVTITRYYDGRKRERDIDNLIGGAKPIIDAMVLEGLIVSDAPQMAEIHWKQERGPSRLLVLLEELA